MSVTITGDGPPTVLGSVTAGAVPINLISAATANNTPTNNADFNIVLNWNKTSNNATALTIGESAASTGGTGNNQVLVKFATSAASTASPFQVWARGAAALVVSPTGNIGLGAVTTYHLDTGQNDTSQMRVGRLLTGAWAGVNGANVFLQNAALAIDAANYALFQSEGGETAINSASGNPLRFRIANGEAMAISSTGKVGVGLAGVIPTALFEIESNTSDTSELLIGQHDASVLPAKIRARRSHGTLAAPTVITTGDAGLVIASDYYVGATNTYQRGSYIEQVSTGTISDSATGVGGIINFYTAVVGAEPALALSIKDTKDVTMGASAPATTAASGFPQMPVMAGTPTGVPTATTGFVPFVYDSTGLKLWVYDFVAAAWKGVALA